MNYFESFNLSSKKLFLLQQNALQTIENSSQQKERLIPPFFPELVFQHPYERNQ